MLEASDSLCRIPRAMEMPGASAISSRKGLLGIQLFPEDPAVVSKV